MDLKKLLIILYEVFVHVGMSIILFVLLVLYYPADACSERVCFSVILMFLVRIDKCLVFISIYLKKSALEFEITIIVSLIVLLNAVENDCVDENGSFYIIFNEVVFYGVLFMNLLAYLYSLLLILIYGVMILVIVLRGGQNNLGVNLDTRGLNNEQMGMIEEKLYRELKEEGRAQNNQNIQNERNINNENNGNQPLQIDIEPGIGQMNENEKVCSICLSEFLDEEIISKLPECNHIFHKECIREWLMRNHICPFCRNDIKRAIHRKKRALLNQRN